MKRVLVLCLAMLSMAFPSSRSAAQAVLLPSIKTVAGTDTSCTSAGAPCGDGGLATAANLGGPFGVAVDTAGNIYIADINGNRIRKVDTFGTITTIAGTGVSCASPTAACGDGGPGTSANLNEPRNVALDSAGNLYIADSGDQRVRKLAQGTGIITTVAGNGTDCSPSTAVCGDGGPPTSANVSPGSVAVDKAGNIYIADGSARVRKITVATGVITTVAGNGTQCSAQTAACGDGGPAASANLYSPNGVAVDAAGNIYIADSGINRVRKVTTTGIISTVAGNGNNCTNSTTSCGDGGAANGANLYYPLGVTVDSAGNLFIADELDNRIRMVAAGTGIITTVAGDGSTCSTSGCGDNHRATNASTGEPASVAVSAGGNLYIADYIDYRIRQVALSGASPSGRVTFLPTGLGSSSAVQNVYIQLSATETLSSITVPVSIGGYGEYLIGTITGCTLGATNPTGTICTVPVTFSPAYAGQRWLPLQVVTSTGTVTFRLEGTGIGPQIALTPGIIATVAGTGTPGNVGDAGPATSAELNYPFGIAIGPSGDFYVSDAYYENVVLKVSASTLLMTKVAGNGSQGFSGDNGDATSATMFYPEALALDLAGNLYIADSQNNRVRKVTAATGIITTVAGDGGTGYAGDNGLAIHADIGSAQGIAVDAAGNIYIAANNNRIRKVAATTGIITTVAGNGTAGWTGDNGSALQAEIQAQFVAVDNAGNIYIVDTQNNIIRKVTAATGVITTLAGNGLKGESGDGEPATSAALDVPYDVAVDRTGNLYILENFGNRVRKVSAATGIITTVAGSDTGMSDGGYSGDGGPATSATFHLPTSLALDDAGDIYVVDMYNHAVRKIYAATSLLSFAPTPVGSTSADSPQQVTVSNIGNAVLFAPSTGTGTNPNASLSANFTFAGSTTCPDSHAGGTLSVGADCLYSINFAPTAPGVIRGQLVLSANILTPPFLTISLMGTATGNIVPTVTVSPSSSSITATQPLTVTIGVSGNPVVTGSVTLTSGSYTSASTPLSSGNAIINILAGSLPVGSDTLTVTYTPDGSGSSTYNSGTGSTVITVTGIVPTITFAVTNHTFGDPPFAVSATSNSGGAMTYSVVSGLATISGSTVTLTGAGGVILQVSQVASGIYAPGLQTASFSVAPAAPTISFSVANHTYGDAGFIVAASSNSSGALTYSVVSGPATINGSTVTPTDAGLVTLQVSQAAAGNYAAATSTASFTVAAAIPSITFTVADHTYGDAAFTVAATSPSSGLFTYSVVSGPATVNGSTVTLTSIGPVTLQANQASSSRYTAAIKTATFNVAAAAPSITFTVPDHTFGDAAFTIAATSNSTGALTYTVVSGPASINGSTITLTGAGQVTLQASQAAATNYTAATKTAIFNVAAATPAITFTVPDHVYGDAPFTIAATSNSTGALTYSVVSGPATINGSTVTLTGSGTVTLQASQASAANYAAATKTTTFNIAAAAPSIAFSVPDHTYGDAPFTVAATSNSTGALTYSVVSGPATINGSTVALTGIGAVTLQASQAAATNYAAATKTATFNVTAAAQTITFTAPASPVTYGTSAIALSASASSGLAIRFSVLSGPGTVSGSSVTITGAGTVVVAADQAGNANYAAATEVTRSIVVNKAAPASVTLTASPNPVLVQNAITLSTTVSSPISAPSGSVAFFDGPTILSTVTLSSGTASFTTSTLATGVHAITAQYLGDSNFTTLTSATAAEIIQDFTFTSGSGTTTQTVSAGGSATYTFPITLSSGTALPALVTFTATGQPAGATATFFPASLPAGNGASTVTLIIALPKTAQLETPGHPGESLPVVALATLLLPFSRRKLRSSRLLKSACGSLALLALFGITTLLAGCGSSGSSGGGGGGGGGVQPGTYNITVTATSGALSHTSTVVLIVQ